MNKESLHTMYKQELESIYSSYKDGFVGGPKKVNSEHYSKIVWKFLLAHNIIFLLKKEVDGRVRNFYYWNKDVEFSKVEISLISSIINFASGCNKKANENLRRYRKVSLEKLKTSAEVKALKIISSLKDFTDAELVKELRRRGYEVTATKLVEL